MFKLPRSIVSPSIFGVVVDFFVFVVFGIVVGIEVVQTCVVVVVVSSFFSAL